MIATPHVLLLSAVLFAIGMAGVLVRQFFVLRHRGQLKWGVPAAGAALLALLCVLLAP